MTISFHSSRRLLSSIAAAAMAACAAGTAWGQPAPGEAQAADSSSATYLVFLQTRAIGREEVALVPQGDGWILRGSGRLGAPIDAVTSRVEIAYDVGWKPRRLAIDATVRGQALTIETTFEAGKASSVISAAGQSQQKEDAVAADTIVLPNQFLGSYVVLARRLVGAQAGAQFRGYVVPQAEVPIRVEAMAAERIDTPQRSIDAARYSLVITNPPPGGDVPIAIWIDPAGGLLRMSVPAQGLEIAREDIASAATRTVAFSVPGDEPVRIAASGFTLGATVTKPAGAGGRLPALVLIGGSGPVDRDETVAGIPVFGQLAERLVEAGFLVVRYDKRGVGQSGGRTETATIADYAEDARAVVKYLERRRDVDRDRIGVVGHSEGAWVALVAADREKRIAAVALVAGASTTGAEVVLEQQARLFDGAKTPEAERAEKVALQQRIHDALLKGASWEGVPDELRAQADTPWFQSFLAFDPASAISRVRQPLLVVQGELDTQVLPHHADRLAEMARARKHKSATVDVLKVPGANHLLVPARTGEASEYATLPDKRISDVAAAGIGTWMARALGPAR